MNESKLQTAIGDNLFPEGYKYKYDLLVAYIKGLTDAYEGLDVPAESAMEAVSNYIKELEQKV